MSPRLGEITSLALILFFLIVVPTFSAALPLYEGVRGSASPHSLVTRMAVGAVASFTRSQCILSQRHIETDPPSLQ
jgi:hypothetical protein